MKRDVVDQRVVEHYADKLSLDHFAILMTAAAKTDYAAAAARLSLPIGTYKSRLNRARAALAKLQAPTETVS